MRNDIKKQSVGTWIMLATFVLLVVSFILYGVNVGGAGYFHERGVGEVVTYSVLGIAFLAAIPVLDRLRLQGAAGKAAETVAGLLRILTSLFTMLALLCFIADRLEGLSYIYFSNEEVLATIQTPDNMRSAGTAIASIALYAVAWLAATAGAFFGTGNRAR